MNAFAGSDAGNPGEEPEFTQQEEQDDVAKISSLIRELDLTGGFARIWRQAPDSAKLHYWGEIPADAFSLEHVRHKYGGGDYVVRFAAKGGRYVRSIKFSIDPSFIGEVVQRQAAAAAASNPSTVPGATSSQPNDMMITYLMQQAQAAQQQSQQMMALFVTMMGESQKTTASVLAAALTGRPQPSSGGDSRIIELMTPLLAESLKPRGGFGELVETVKAVRELTGDGHQAPAPKEDEDSNMIGKIATLATPLLAAWMSRGQSQPQQQPPPPAGRGPAMEPMPLPSIGSPPTAPLGNPAMPTPTPAEQAAMAKAEELITKLRSVTPMLVNAAAKDSQIDFYLGILDDNLDDESYAILCQLLEQPDWTKILFNDHPGVMRHIGWFNNLRDMILHDEGEAAGAGEGEGAGEVPRPGGTPLDPQQRP